MILLKCIWLIIKKFIRIECFQWNVFLSGGSLSKKIRLPDVTPVKTGLCRISRELKFKVCNYGEQCASPHVTREEGCFKEWQRKLGNQKSMVFHWLTAWRKEGKYTYKFHSESIFVYQFVHKSNKVSLGTKLTRSVI